MFDFRVQKRGGTGGGAPHHESPLYRLQPFPSRFFFKRWMLNTSSAPLNAPNQEQQMKSGDKKRVKSEFVFSKISIPFSRAQSIPLLQFPQGMLDFISEIL